MTFARRMQRVLAPMMPRHSDAGQQRSNRACGFHAGSRSSQGRGFSLIELVVAVAIIVLMAAMSIPIIGTSMSRMKVNSAVSAINGAVTQTRYRAIRTSQIYTLAITTPPNTYVVTNVTTNAVDNAVPLPNQVALNGGAAAVYTFTFCPNGTVYGAGGVCPNGNLPPALSATYQTRQTNMSFSTVGNVTTTLIH